VEIRFPAVSQESCPIAEPLSGESEALHEGRETILIVDDEQSVRRIFCRALRGQGYRILEASNAEEAMRVAGESGEPISLLLTDVVMPGANGLDLYRQLEPRIPGLRVLYISGYGEEEIARHGMLETGALVVSKPVSMRELSRKVRALLDTRGSA
jgi:DNA-binding response OmpR family regulator